MKVESLVVGYPWASPFIWTQAAENMCNLIRPPGIPTTFIRGLGWCPARRHIDICEKAVALGVSHILIIGADQVHPLDLIPRLVRRVEEDDCEVIAALVPTRGHVPGQNTGPFQPMAWRFKHNASMRQYRSMELDGDMIELIDPRDGDLQRFDFIGSGCIMFPVDDLLMLKQPWFFERATMDRYKRFATMDTAFSWRLHQEAYAKLWVDTTIKIRHLNIFEVDESYSDRFADWEEAGYGTQKHGDVSVQTTVDGAVLKAKIGKQDRSAQPGASVKHALHRAGRVHRLDGQRGDLGQGNRAI